MNWFIKGGVMRKIIIFIFLVLTFICSCSEKSETAKAVENLNKAIKLQPNNIENYNKRGTVYYNLGQEQRAIEDYNQAIRLNPNYTVAYYNRGNAYANLGQYLGAIEDYNQVIRLKPNNADAYNNRGLVYLNLGNKELGCNDIKKACELGNCKRLEEVKARGYCR
jgi:tetratricopeptide (TPR) repeat protein